MKVLNLSMPCFPICSDSGPIWLGGSPEAQRQMLAVARGLIARPKLLILDEPSAGLSPKMARARLHQNCARYGTAASPVLLVEQNVRAALALADRAAVLVEGKERIVASTADLLNDSSIAKLYLGRNMPGVSNRR